MTTRKRPPSPPKGTSASGRELWRQVVSRYHLDAHELGLLREAVRTLSDLDALADVIARDGHMLPDGRVHPAVVEARQQRITVARLIAALRLPEDAADDNRPQRRGGARGVYALPAVTG
jgi:hypothetical protein